MKANRLLSLSQKIHQVYVDLCRPVCKEYGISQVSFDILLYLANAKQGSTAQEISEFYNIKKNLVSIHVDKLVRAGYLLRESVRGDRRKIALCCTERANPILDAGARIYTELFEGMTRGLSLQEVEQCYQSLCMVEANATAMLNAGVSSERKREILSIEEI